MFGIEKNGHFKSNISGRDIILIFGEMRTAAQQIADWVEAHLYIDWHPRSNYIPSPNT